MRPWAGFLAVLCLSAGSTGAQTSFVNWESPHVHPLELTPDGLRLLAVNTPDNRLEVFDLSGPSPVRVGSVPVGLDPVSVRARSSNEAWVVNHVSDSVSVVRLDTLNVVATLRTADEPADVVFAGSPQRAFVSCSQANLVQVFDLDDLASPAAAVPIDAEDPRAMAVSADGSEVYVAVFESGNASTALGGGFLMSGGFPPRVASFPDGPYGGLNPPPNDANEFNPPQNLANPPPPPVALIVKKSAGGAWLDDNGGDWTPFVSGSEAARSGRVSGWDLPDRDVAVIDAASLNVSYAARLMNLCMALAVHPASGQVAVVGTDATNEVRFEPNLRGRFLRVRLALVDPLGPSLAGSLDLNPHLDYSAGTVAQELRDLSLGDPRGLVWNAAGTRGYVSGMGSNNVAALDASGQRAGAAPIVVGEGPTGLALDEPRSRLYVLNKFEASVSVVSTQTELETSRVAFFDPSPAAIQLGRKHLYDTRKTSGLGHTSCASCHVDARMDRLAWDLGDPAGTMKSPAGQNLGMGIPGQAEGFEDWHPMKGPMTTQTLQDIIGKEPLHWRGDRTGLEEFNPAFSGLLGDDASLTASEMQQFENFLATIHFPPNPFRNFDNTLPQQLALPGHYTTGRFGPAGLPLPEGSAVRGLSLFRPPRLLDQNALPCVTCHTLPTGLGADMTLNLAQGRYVPIPPGPNGERHHAMVSQDGHSNVSMKIAHLRNLYEKVGFEATQPSNRAGFGFLNDGSIDSIARFVSEPIFTVQSNQEVADLVAFMLAFSGSGLPQGSATNLFEPPGSPSLDAHAAVGWQTTVTDGAGAPAEQQELISRMIGLAEAGAAGLVVKGRQSGLQRGYAYGEGGQFQSDRAAESLGPEQLRLSAVPGSELTYTVVPAGSETRIGIDRDEDGYLDRDELDAGTDPADPASHPEPATATATQTPAATTPTATATQTPAATTPTATATQTPAATTPTETVTRTPATTPPTETRTPSATSPVSAETATSTRSATQTETPSVTRTHSPGAEPSATDSATATPTAVAELVRSGPHALGWLLPLFVLSSFLRRRRRRA